MVRGHCVLTDKIAKKKFCECVEKGRMSDQCFVKTKVKVCKGFGKDMIFKGRG